MTSFTLLPPTVRSYIGGFVSRRRRVRLVRAGGLAAGVFLFWMLAWCLVDRLVPLPGWLRLGLLVVGVAAVGVLLLRPLRDALAPAVDWVTAAGEIESKDPAFAQRLQTVTSCLLNPPEQRGSAELLNHLLGEVESQVSNDHPHRLMSWRHAIHGWLPAAALALLIALGSMWAWLDLPRLMMRFIAPLSPAPPASLTRIEATHTPSQAIQGEPITFRARATHLGDEAVRLHLSADGRNWSSRLMPPAGEEYVYTLPAAERDFRYVVTAGDGRTLEQFVRVLRRPSVVEFRIRYTYPAYTQRPPLTVSNSDGILEAPVGTEAAIAIVASEPLADARVLIDGQELETQPTIEPTVRQIKLPIEKDQSWEVRLTSAQGATGDGPGRMILRALPDRAPIVRLVQPSEDLRLTPRDVVALHYLAMDDYGLESLQLITSVNGGDPRRTPIGFRGDTRRQEGRIDLDLATLDVQIGDIVRIGFDAADGGGQAALSEPRHILISPRSIDMNTYQRLAELRQAHALAEAMLEELKAARTAYRAIPRDQLDLVEGWLVSGEYDQHLVSASEAGLLLRQTLLRSMMRSTSPHMSDTLANLIDNAQLASSLADHTVSRTPLSDSQTIESLLGRAQDKAQKLTERLTIILHGEHAAAIAADRANIAAVAARDAKSLDDAARRSLERAREEVAAGARALKLNPDAADLDQQLQARMAAMERLSRELVVIDFAEVSKPWAQKPEDLKQPVALQERLAAAAQAEAVRPDADLLRARDLQLSAQAASGLENRVTIISDTEIRRPAELQQYPDALAALQREHRLNRHTQDVRDPAEVKRITTEAEAARQKMRLWAGLEESPKLADANTEPAGDVPGADAADAMHAEQLAALESSALQQQKQYDAARKLDEALAQRNPANAPPMAPANPGIAPPPGKLSTEAEATEAALRRQQAAEAQRQQRLEQAVQTSQKLDEIAARQRQITEATARRRADEARDLSQRQEGVAQSLDAVRKRVVDPLDLLPDEQQSDTRGQAMAAIAAAQQRLAAMPQQLTDTQEAAARQQQAQAAAEQARRAAEAAAPDAKPAAQRTAEQARQAAEQAADAARETARDVSPDTAEALARDLSPFSPETAPAVDVLKTRLAGALRTLSQALNAADAGSADRAAGEARQAIRAAQEELRNAQAQLAEQDPLVAAEWFAREAAMALAQEPPDFETALRSQAMAQSALARAWQQSVRQAAQLRLAGTGAMRSLYQIDLVLPLSGRGGGLAMDGAGIPGEREWGRARRRDEADRSATGRETDPPGYQEALRAYFEALGQAQEKPKP